MKNIVRIKFGSHLYGTTTPSSDIDYKSVYIPDAHDILLQRVRGSINSARKKAEKEKNLPGEVEEESYSLQRYLELASEGQTVALDILFAPDWAMVEPPSPEWLEIVANRDKLVTKKSAAFVGYCRQQANKYGIKGSRVAAARNALAILERGVSSLGTTAKLGELAAEIDAANAESEHMSIDKIESPGGPPISHWNVCGRKLQFTATIKHGRDVIAKLVAEYGQRALQAESQQGVDWKALSHSVRVGTQAIELLSTGHVTFPLPNAKRVMEIKTGRIPYQEVSAEIEWLLEAVEAEAAKSTLPSVPNRQWIDDFVTRVYREAVCRA